jgi:aminoglycoside/choline kinase family phosphotransferase
MELLSFYYELSEHSLNWSEFQLAFWEASAQRLMQALGAYGFLANTKGLRVYLNHVPAATRNLHTAVKTVGSLPALSEVCAACEVSLASAI